MTAPDITKLTHWVVPVSSYFTQLFKLRYVLDLVGYDPCDDWTAEEVLQYPDGLYYLDGRAQFSCRVCERMTDWEGEIAEFEFDAYENVCGGSPRCCP